MGILARNRSEWVESMIGCFKSRTVPINLNFRYVAPELRYVIDNADLEVLVYERGLSQLVADSTGRWDDPATPPCGHRGRDDRRRTRSRRRHRYRAHSLRGGTGRRLGPSPDHVPVP